MNATGREDSLSAGDVEPRLRTRWLGRVYSFHHCLGSTNDEVARLARTGAPEGTLVVADTQTGGRGRLGRSWVSPPRENLYFSFLLRPAWQASDLPPLSLVVAVGLARGLEPFVGTLPRLKWPNDVLCAGRKLSGILVEMATEEARVAHVVVGIGLNVNQQSFPGELSGIATSLRAAAAREFPRAEVLATVLLALERSIERIYQGDRAALLAEWEERACHLGREIEVRGRDGSVRGVALGISPSGALIVRDAAGRRQEVLAGDVQPIEGFG